MRAAIHLTLCSALLCLPLFATASSVQRCEDASGKIMFTTLGCPAGHSTRLQSAFNAHPEPKSICFLLQTAGSQRAKDPQTRNWSWSAPVMMAAAIA